MLIDRLNTCSGNIYCIHRMNNNDLPWSKISGNIDKKNILKQKMNYFAQCFMLIQKFITYQLTIQNTDILHRIKMQNFGLYYNIMM